jgi:hypothetical protein
MSAQREHEADADQAEALIAMSAALTRQFQQAGQGAPNWRELADEAISYGAKARAALAPDDPRRGPVSYRLGNVLAIRRTALGGSESDQDEAIGAFDEFLALPGGTAEQGQLARFWLGYLLMVRAMRLPMPGYGRVPDQRSLLSLMASFKPAPGAAEDIARAVGFFGQVLDGEMPEPQMRRIATALRAMTELMQTILISPPGAAPADPLAMLGVIMRAFQALAPGDPGHTELAGMHAWLNAEYLREHQLPDPGGAAMRALEETASQVGPGHMLHAVLQLELGLTTAHQARQSGGERLRTAAEHVSQARAEMGDWPDHPLYDDSLRVMAGTMLSSAAWEPDEASIKKVISLARQLLADRDPADTAGIAKDTYLLGMALTLRAVRGRQAEDWTAATNALYRALTLIPRDDPMAGTMLSTYGAVLNDHYQYRGSLADAHVAQSVMEQASKILAEAPDGQPLDNLDALNFTGLRGACRIALAFRSHDPAELAIGQAEVERALAGLPDTYPWRSRLIAGRGLGQIASGIWQGDYAAVRDGLADLSSAAEVMQVDQGSRGGFEVIGAVATVLDGRIRSDAGAVAQGLEALAKLVVDPGLPERERLQGITILGLSHLIMDGFEGRTGDLELGIMRLEQARSRVDVDPGNPVAASLLAALARAYRTRGDRADGAPYTAEDHELATKTGRAALRAQVYDVLLQQDAGHALVIARGAAGQAVQIARWLLADGQEQEAVEALELGRGLVLHAATVTAQVPEILREAGQDSLAAEWEKAEHGAPPPAWAAAADVSDPSRAITTLLTGSTVQPPPGDLRQRVVAALDGTEHVRRLLTAPAPDALPSALHAAGADALAYLLPGTAGGDGQLLVLFADGAIERIPVEQLGTGPDSPVLAYLAAEQARRSRGAETAADQEAAAHREQEWEAALDTVTRWAWGAVGPLLAAVRRRGLFRSGLLTCGPRVLPRVVLVPGGMLGAVPWHAAWTDEATGPEGTAAGRRYACREAVFTYAASARQFTETQARAPLPLTADPVFIVGPVGEPGASARRAAVSGPTLQTVALRAMFYPDARGLGHTGREGDPDATPERVEQDLPGAGNAGASLLQFSCHAVSAGSPLTSHLALQPPAGGPQEAGLLDVARILRRGYGRDPATRGSLVVLAACVTDMTPGDYDEALTLSTAFLAAGAANVVGSRWEISAGVTPVLMFMLHHYLVRAGMAVADALQAAQAWMLDSDREVPVDMPFRAELRRYDCAHPGVWAAFIHQGN